MAFSVEPSSMASGTLTGVDRDPQGDDADVVGEVDPVDHERDQVHTRQVRGHEVGQGRLGGLDEPPGDRRLARRGRLLADLLTDRLQADAVAARRQPSIALRPSISVPVNTS